jgi:16S rRNA (adenine1518-N6/adenine1519-N6)-dimethyltransferase
MVFMSLLEETKFLLRRYRIFPKKALGQHFLVESSVLQSIVGYASIGRSDVVLDIGAGFGFLTRLLAGKCGAVLAVESDVGLVKVLCERLKSLSNVKVVEGDVLQLPVLEFSKVVSVPPYNISSALLLWLFRQKFECAVLVFQREFVDRLVASVGGKNYGWLGVVAYYHVDVEVLDEVPREMFYPQPEVDSVVVRLRPRKPLPFVVKDEELFRQLVQALFTRRNRKVRNALVPFVRGKFGDDADSVLERLRSFPFFDRRVRELAPEDFGALLNGFAW